MIETDFEVECYCDASSKTMRLPVAARAGIADSLPDSYNPPHDPRKSPIRPE